MFEQSLQVFRRADKTTESGRRKHDMIIVVWGRVDRSQLARAALIPQKPRVRDSLPNTIPLYHGLKSSPSEQLSRVKASPRPQANDILHSSKNNNLLHASIIALPMNVPPFQTHNTQEGTRHRDLEGGAAAGQSGTLFLFQPWRYQQTEGRFRAKASASEKLPERTYRPTLTVVRPGAHHGGGKGSKRSRV